MYVKLSVIPEFSEKDSEDRYNEEKYSTYNDPEYCFTLTAQYSSSR